MLGHAHARFQIGPPVFLARFGCDRGVVIHLFPSSCLFDVQVISPIASEVGSVVKIFIFRIPLATRVQRSTGDTRKAKSHAYLIDPSGLRVCYKRGG